MGECYIEKLPNELLLHLFSFASTPDLLPLTLISRRLSTIILRILHNRLVKVAELHSHSVLLECYHPSAKPVEPPYFCTYQGTHGLSLYETRVEDEANIGARLGNMRSMYSRYRPHQQELESGGRRVVRRPGDVPGSRTFPGTVQDKYRGENVKQKLNLEAHELFTQLVVQTNLVKIGSLHGLFTGFVNIEEGVARVWKDWLAAMASRAQNADIDIPVEVVEVGMGKQPTPEVCEEAVLDELGILWVGMSKNTGIRFKVRELKFRREAPILVRADEDTPVTYEIEYDELFMRTSHLLLMLEKSLVQEDNSSGQAVVFGSFG
ncbi:hypothetical protein GQ44DRAFT_737182 [Phaeosphaeriaceae sp. PMI808]|nr:hypothetical protein GQ44DRAFT_737182 [Phaeosphaeriaceae sp. PMI808]